MTPLWPGDPWSLADDRCCAGSDAATDFRIASTDFVGFDDAASGVARQRDGKIVAAGTGTSRAQDLELRHCWNEKALSQVRNPLLPASLTVFLLDR